MFHRPTLVQGDRFRLPPRTFAKFLEDHRAGVTDFELLCADGLSPGAFEPIDPELWGQTFQQFVPRVLFFAGPSGEHCLHTMDSDQQDRAAFPLEPLRTQWLEMVRCDPKWTRVRLDNIRSAARVEMYLQMRQYHHVVVTEETAGYGNLGLVLNLADSEALASIPEIIPVELATDISWAGHAVRFTFVPDGALQGVRNPRQKFHKVAATVEEMTAALSGCIVPDIHPQDASTPQSSTLSFCVANSSARERVQNGLGQAWNAVEYQMLNDDEFRTVATHHRTILIQCAKTAPGGPSVTMVNGVSIGF